MRIAITGSDGYIGSRLCAALENTSGVELLKLSIIKKNNGYIYTDYSFEDLCRVLVGVEMVIHLAAIRAGQTIRDFYPNFDITENLYNAMGYCGVKRMVFMSSIAVYSEESKLPWKEDQIVSPYTLYGIGKLACENMCYYYGRKYSITNLILRLAPIYGPYDNNKRMIAYFLMNARQNQAIVVKGKSIAQRDFIYVDDVVRVISMFIKVFPQSDEIYNVGSDERHTNLEIARLVQKGFGTTCEIKYEETVSENISSAYMDITKLKSLGFVATPMEEAFVKIAKEESDV